MFSSLINCFFLPVCSGNRGSDIKDESEGATAADSDNANHPPPAKLLQDWARTPLPHVCPYCGKTFTRRIFLRTHVFSHTGEKLFTCKVTIRIHFKFAPFQNLRDNFLCCKCHLCWGAELMDNSIPLQRIRFEADTIKTSSLLIIDRFSRVTAQR